MLIEVQYLPAIPFFVLANKYQTVTLEKHENFVKSTYRNRAFLCGPNGRLDLSIPLLGGKGQRKKITEVKIDNRERWQKIHWQSLTSAYRSAPYFEFYEHEIEPFYTNEFENLFEFNLQLIEKITQLLKLNITYQFTESWEREPENDWRSKIHPKPRFEQLPSNYIAPKYMQVFEDRQAFMPNLSSLDLLFNEGPAAGSLVQAASKTLKD